MSVSTQVGTHPQTTPLPAGIEQAGTCVDVTFLVRENDGQLVPASDTYPKSATPDMVPMLLLIPAATERPEASIHPDPSLLHHHSLTILRSVVLHI
jgi:hypothetical protein